MPFRIHLTAQPGALSGELEPWPHFKSLSYLTGSFKPINKDQTCDSPITLNRSHCGSFVLAGGDPGTEPWLCSFVDWGRLCVRCSENLSSVEKDRNSHFFPSLAKFFFPGWRTECILLEQGEVVFPRWIPLLPLWSKFSRAAGKAPGGVPRKEPPSSWVPGSCTGLVAAQDSYLHIWCTIIMPTNTFCLFAVFFNVLTSSQRMTEHICSSGWSLSHSAEGA